MFVFYVFLVSLVTRAEASGSYFCGNGYSSRREFKCLQGTDCVEKENVCDGSKDCLDGSDEESCVSKEPPKPACILPPYPAHGTYELLSEPKANLKGPGQAFQFFVLRVSCARGYGMVEAGYDKDLNGTLNVVCINGEWSPTMPSCVRFCRLDPDPSIRYMCYGRVCKNYIAPGTLVNPQCNRPIYYSTDSLLYMKCKSGTWDYIGRCKADCGRLTPKGVELVINGKVAKRGELPWHVGIYRKSTFEQICGGSLVSTNVVISAAHCFWLDDRKVLPPAGFAVAIGKLYRQWDDERDSDAQKSDVKEIRVPPLFEGVAASFQEDIAALILTTPFTYKIFVRPICLNFDVIFDTLQLQHGNLGKVAGWGLTAANGLSSQTLQAVEMPFINEGTCVNSLPQTFRPYITGDKFCAGYTNGTALCRGDSGGGIVFAEREQGIDRYYLRGIVSSAPNVDGQLCNDKTYTTFTKIRRHEDFIKNALVDANLVRSCPAHMFQCNDDTCEDLETDCKEN